MISFIISGIIIILIVAAAVIVAIAIIIIGVMCVLSTVRYVDHAKEISLQGFHVWIIGCCMFGTIYAEQISIISNKPLVYYLRKIFSLNAYAILIVCVIFQIAESENIVIQMKVEVTYMNRALNLMMEFLWVKETTWKLRNKLGFQNMLATGIKIINLIFPHQLLWWWKIMLVIQITPKHYHTRIGVQALEIRKICVKNSWAPKIQQKEIQTLNTKLIFYDMESEHT